MNIMVPLSCAEMLERFCRAGADEFYIGFYDPAWDMRFGTFEEINRMSSFGSLANFPLQALEEIIARIHILRKKVFVTLNSATYSFEQIQWMDRYIQLLRSVSVDGIILGSLELLHHLRGCGIPLTLSTMGGAYNSDIVSFYQDMGIRRLILPRDMTLPDMERIVPRFPHLEFEVFLMRNGCKYSDSNCMTYHSRRYGSMCAVLDTGAYTIETNRTFTHREIREIHANHALFTKAFHKRACGLCAVDNLLQMGISSVKIVGRADAPDVVAADIQQVRALIDGPGNSEMCAGENCLYNLNCYYHIH